MGLPRLCVCPLPVNERVMTRAVSRERRAAQSRSIRGLFGGRAIRAREGVRSGRSASRTVPPMATLIPPSRGETMPRPKMEDD